MLITFYVTAIVVAVLTILGFLVRGIFALSELIVLARDIAVQFRPDHGETIVDRMAKVEAAITGIHALLDDPEVVPILREFRQRRSGGQ